MKKIVYRTVVKRYSNKELARIYNCCTKTINRRIKPIRAKLGPRDGHEWSIEQVELIFAHLDAPYEVIEVNEGQTTKLEPFQMVFHPEAIEPARNVG